MAVRPSSPGQRPAGGRPWVLPLLVALLLASFTLRAWHASAKLDNTRHFDERFSLRNVEAVLSGTLRPANAYYPSLSYLPQTAVLAASQGLHRLTGWPALAIHDDEAPDGWSATAYLLCRLVSVAAGTLSIWVTFLVGRRLFGPREGLLAAALLAAVPAHLVSSTLFKPDVLVVLFTVLTFHWALAAAHAETRGSLLRAGAGVGLAVAAKYTGVGAALPVVAAGLWGGPWRLQRWRRLVLAGLVAVAVFFLLNPYLAVIFDYLPRLWGIMESKGEAAGGSRLAVLGQEVAYLMRHHGSVVALLAAVGLGGLAVRALGRSTPRQRRMEAVLLLSYVVGYSLLYAAATALFKGQNYLPVTAFTSLAAAWVAVRLWDRLAARLPALAAPVPAALLWAPLVALLFAPVTTVAYRGVVPSTYELAERWLGAHLQPVELRYAFYEKEETPLRVARRGSQLPTIGVEALAQRTPQELARADAEVFFQRRLAGPEAPFYLERLAQARVRPKRFEPGFLRAHGPALALLLHPWTLAAKPLPLELRPGAGAARFRVALPPLEAGEVISLSLWLPLERGVPRPGWVRLGATQLGLFETRALGRRARYVTPRTVLSTPDRPVVLRLPESLALPWTPEVRLLRWRRVDSRE